MQTENVTTKAEPLVQGSENAKGKDGEVYVAFLKTLIGRQGILWQGALTGSGIAMEIRYAVPNWSTKKHHRLIRIVEVHHDFLVIEEYLPDAKDPHTRYMIPFMNLVISENIGAART